MESKSIKSISIILGIMAIYYALLECLYFYNSAHIAITTNYDNIVYPGKTVSLILTSFGFVWNLLLMIWFLIMSRGTKRKAFGVLAAIALSIYIFVRACLAIQNYYLHLEDTEYLGIYFTVTGVLSSIGNLLLSIAFFLMARHLAKTKRAWSVAIGIIILVIWFFDISQGLTNVFLTKDLNPTNYVRTSNIMYAISHFFQIVKYVFMVIFFFLCSKREQKHNAGITEGLEVAQ